MIEDEDGESKHVASDVSQFLQTLLQNKNEINKLGQKEIFEDSTASFIDLLGVEIPSQTPANNKQSAFIYPVIAFACVVLVIILLNVYVFCIFDRNKSKVKRLHRMIKRRKEPRPDISKYESLSQNEWLLEQC